MATGGFSAQGDVQISIVLHDKRHKLIPFIVLKHDGLSHARVHAEQILDHGLRLAILHFASPLEDRCRPKVLVRINCQWQLSA